MIEHDSMFIFVKVKSKIHGLNPLWLMKRTGVYDSWWTLLTAVSVYDVYVIQLPLEIPLSFITFGYCSPIKFYGQYW